ncbi:phage terminase small subunit-related protein [Flavobacterium muglaense]|nr:phage terminase small subunit-related protein [Flavobacterium muglaense]
MKLEKMKMIRLYPNEEFKEIIIEDKLKLRYAISNKGRLISFVDNMKCARELKGAMTDGYRMFRYKLYSDGQVKNKHLFIYKLVAEYFIPKTSEEQIHVLHLDRKRDNDDYRNLKWATKEEMAQHRRESPYVKEAQLNLVKHNLESNGRKLTITKVMLIKKILSKPGQTTRLKMIAKQFGVSEMQIRRIKSGENWSQVKI